MILGDNYKFLYSKGEHWRGPVLLNPGATQWVAPARTLMAQMYLIGGGGNGGNTARGSQQGRSNAGGGGAGGIVIKTFLIDPGQVVHVSVGTSSNATTAVFAPAGVNLRAGAGGDGQDGNQNGSGVRGAGGNATGGDVNIDGGRGGSGNGQNGRGGGGGAPNGADGGSQGPNSGYMGNCMTNTNGIFALLNAVGINTPLCGPNSNAGSDGSNGDRGSGGSGASRTRNSPNQGGRGGSGLIIVRWLVKS